jgi:hypothetical protein
MSKSDNIVMERIPDEIYMEAHINLATDYAMELQKRATARLSVAIQHYDHMVDLTEYPFYCSDCEKEIPSE